MSCVLRLSNVLSWTTMVRNSCMSFNFVPDGNKSNTCTHEVSNVIKNTGPEGSVILSSESCDSHVSSIQ